VHLEAAVSPQARYIADPGGLTVDGVADADDVTVLVIDVEVDLKGEIKHTSRGEEVSNLIQE